jgi:hypothetical protein
MTFMVESPADCALWLACAPLFVGTAASSEQTAPHVIAVVEDCIVEFFLGLYLRGDGHAVVLL